MGDQSNFSIQPNKPNEPFKGQRTERIEPQSREKERFKEVLRERKRDPDDLEEANLLDDVEEGNDSIFTISSKMRKPKKEKLEDSQPDLAFVDDEGDSGLASEDAGKQKVDLSQETRPDLALTNPMGAKDIKVDQAAIGQKGAPDPTARTEMYELATQMVEKITTLKTSGEVKTEVLLQHPPLFKGAIVKISEFDTAKGEFNLSFENLTPQAKHLVDLDPNRMVLKQALEEKGYVLHIIRTNTEIEAPIETGEAYARGDEQQQQEQQQGQQQEEEEA